MLFRFLDEKLQSAATTDEKVAKCQNSLRDIVRQTQVTTQKYHELMGNKENLEQRVAALQNEVLQGRL